MKISFLVNLLLILLVVLIITFSLYVNSKSDFAGTDSAAKDLILSINPEYTSWFNKIWEPPGPEMETLLFSLQAAIGSAVLAFGLGYFIGKKGKSNDQH